MSNGIPFGKPNSNCATCGDERGGDAGHYTHECRYVPGMTAGQLADTMTPEKAQDYWRAALKRLAEIKEDSTDA